MQPCIDNNMKQCTSSKYLNSYAAIEASELINFPKLYAHVLVVPAYNEPIGFLKHFSTIVSHPQKSLVVVVLNYPECASALAVNQYKDCLAFIDKHFFCLWKQKNLSLWQTTMQLDILLIEKPNLLKKHAVGVARKIGADVALALQMQKKIVSPWIHTSDADVIFPKDYFLRVRLLKPTSYAALLYPFSHQAVDSSLLLPMQLYETALYYYVAGLKWADSPYAFHSIGSTIVLNKEAYGKVRGYPARAAGEDFYLLNKLAKINKIKQLGGLPLSVQGRLSDRVPFGTGVALQKISNYQKPLEEYLFYAPELFFCLRLFLDTLRRLDCVCDWPFLSKKLHATSPTYGGFLINVLIKLGFPDFFAKATLQSSEVSILHRHVTIWLDGFRTLKCLHHLRDGYFPSINLTSLQHRLKQGPFWQITLPYFAHKVGNYLDAGYNASNLSLPLNDSYDRRIT